jgi:hypothetical protein
MKANKASKYVRGLQWKLTKDFIFTTLNNLTCTIKPPDKLTGDYITSSCFRSILESAIFQKSCLLNYTDNKGFSSTNTDPHPEFFYKNYYYLREEESNGQFFKIYQMECVFKGKPMVWDLAIKINHPNKTNSASVNKA